jgi:hypothetical protein
MTRGLAMLDRRVGKRRLVKLDVKNEHGFIRLCYRLRCEAENIVIDDNNAHHES